MIKQLSGTVIVAASILATQAAAQQANLCTTLQSVYANCLRASQYALGSEVAKMRSEGADDNTIRAVMRGQESPEELCHMPADDMRSAGCPDTDEPSASGEPTQLLPNVEPSPSSSVAAQPDDGLGISPNDPRAAVYTAAVQVWAKAVKEASSMQFVGGSSA